MEVKRSRPPESPAWRLCLPTTHTLFWVCFYPFKKPFSSSAPDLSQLCGTIGHRGSQRSFRGQLGSCGHLEWPFLLVQILSDIHTVSAPFCFLQIFCVYTYGSVEFSNLAIISYDRYLAICYPLQYNTHMTSNKVVILITVIWLYSFVKFLITLSLNIHLTLCGNTINSLYCHNYLVAKLACSNVKVNNIYGLFSISFSILVPLILILFSYMKILNICFSGSKQTRQKAVSTCTPHFTSLLNFSFGCCFEILQSRFDMTSVPSVFRIILSLYFLIIQPLMNPFMYGLQMSKIRNTCKHVLLYKFFAYRRDTK
ncbi:olfactory receptor 140-like [Perca fluviatilis]|uniref:olfactory receptor 140-like n=1 Tax=Perca fluviatilis TaxID=8168 RepID=UPI0019661F13|nr:olfactory receptor 140-like [Perca fluviatilis]